MTTENGITEQPEIYTPNNNRYSQMKYNRCGKSGIFLPAMSLGLWHNFGEMDSFSNAKKMIFKSFDLGITHFDLANNYGPPYGSAEKTFGKILTNELKSHRDELLISTKAGYDMWPGPYGNNGSRKYLIASLDQSLKRLNCDYVDLFYHHRPDSETPIEETAGALADIVHQGKALYVGISNYNAEDTLKMIRILKHQGVHCLIHQAKYSMLVRWVEKDLLNTLDNEGVGCIAFSPLAEGILSGKYNNGLPNNSRATKSDSHLKHEWLFNERLEKISRLSDIACERGQTMTQMALSWVIRDSRVTSVLIGASSASQIEENVKAVQQSTFSDLETDLIESILDNKTEFLRNL